MRYPLSLLLLAFGPLLVDAATISAPLSFTATNSTQAFDLAVAPNPNSPIPGIAAEASFAYTWSVTNPTGCTSTGNACYWSFRVSGDTIVSGEFSIGGAVQFGDGNDVEVVGQQSGMMYFPAGNWTVTLSSFSAYNPALIVPPNPTASITLGLTPIFGSITDPPAPVEVPEPAGWISVLTLLACCLSKRASLHYTLSSENMASRLRESRA